MESISRDEVVCRGKRVETMLQAEEGVLYADLDMNDCIQGKQYHDLIGGYQRLDVFDLRSIGREGSRRRSMMGRSAVTEG